ncbi:MAG: hypothetical protein ACJART_001886 [Maribacter sp.]|jgi:hypothetical protein
MKKINFTQLPKTSMNRELLNFGQINATAIKYRMKIDTLSELHDQLRHHEYKEYLPFTFQK